jgi:hypothetical protein
MIPKLIASIAALIAALSFLWIAYIISKVANEESAININHHYASSGFRG